MRYAGSASELPSFVAVEVATDAEADVVASEPVGVVPSPTVPARTPPPKPWERRSGVIEIELGAGPLGDVDAAALRRVLDVLDRR